MLYNLSLYHPKFRLGVNFRCTPARPGVLRHTLPGRCSDSACFADSCWFAALQLTAAVPHQMRRGPVDEECPTALRATGLHYRVYQRRAMRAMGADAV